jgi:hypothetical protein
MARLVHFAGVDGLEWESLPAHVGGSSLITLKGLIGCLGGIVIAVDKTLIILDASDNPHVQTIDYAYNAWVRGHFNFLRYDNAHVHPGHPDPHHRHKYDWRTGRGVVEHVGEGAWPTLGDFIREVEAWRDDHHNELVAVHSQSDFTDIVGLRSP